jgi:hypothetical protein
LGHNFERASGQVTVGLGAIEVVHRGEYGANHFGNDRIAIRGAIPFDACAKVREFGFGSGCSVAVFLDQVPFNFAMHRLEKVFGVLFRRFVREGGFPRLADRVL